MVRNEKGQFVKGEKLINLTGRRFGKLFVVGLDHVQGNRTYWKVRCECGVEKAMRADVLKSAKSCGCLSKENKYTTHGRSRTRLYSILQNMKDRCYNPNNHAYALYGGRGITVCDEWLGECGAENFMNWALENGYDENAPRGQCTIDRIDNDKGYSPDNCRWADKDIQNYNKRCTRKIIVDGKEKTILDLHDEYGISITTLRSRYWKYIHDEITVDELISKDKLVNKAHQISITVNGITHNLSEWEKETGVSRKTIINRYRKGARSYEKLFEKSR